MIFKYMEIMTSSSCVFVNPIVLRAVTRAELNASVLEKVVDYVSKALATVC